MALVSWSSNSVIDSSAKDLQVHCTTWWFHRLWHLWRRHSAFRARKRWSWCIHTPDRRQGWIRQEALIQGLSCVSYFWVLMTFLTCWNLLTRFWNNSIFNIVFQGTKSNRGCRLRNDDTITTTKKPWYYAHRRPPYPRVRILLTSSYDQVFGTSWCPP